MAIVEELYICSASYNLRSNFNYHLLEFYNLHDLQLALTM